MTVLPGEKLSRVGPSAASSDAPIEDEELRPIEEGEFAAALTDEGDGDGGRRRRRRGGRGRGRGRGRDEVTVVGETAAAAPRAAEPSEEEAEDLLPEEPRRPRTTAFGSFWDSQLGVPSAPARGPVQPLGDDEDFEEPEIPEYLIAEQRRGRQQQQQGGRGGGRGRGGRSAYTAAIERERYGRGGSTGGINRYPDVSGRDRQGGAPQRGGGGGRDAGYVRNDRPERTERAPRPSGGDPWSEVPPELEEMLRAQLAQTSKGRPTAPQGPTASEPAPIADVPAAAEAAGAPKRRTTRKASPSAAGVATATPGAVAEPAGAPKRRTTRKPATATAE